VNDLAKVFRDARGQSVRLPEEFEVEGSELRIRREGRRIVLEPVEEEPKGDWIDAIAGKFDEEFAKSALDRPGPDSYERPDISFDRD